MITITPEDIHLIKLKQLTFHQNNKHRFSVDRVCSGCKKRITSSDVMFIGESEVGVWFNHDICKSTMLQLNDVWSNFSEKTDKTVLNSV